MHRLLSLLVVLASVLASAGAQTSGVTDNSIFVTGEDGVSAPKLISPIDLPLPAEVRAQRTEAKLEYLTIVRKNGTLDKIESQSCGLRKHGKSEFKAASVESCRPFDVAARESLSKRRYEPAMKDGTAVDVYYSITVQYILH